jgi:DNA polymerase III epsilon subunit-like protein
MPNKNNDSPKVSPLDFEKPVLVWDTETSGLARPAICQIAYILYEDGATVEYCKILRLPGGLRMTRQAQEIHKISQSMCDAGAYPVPELYAFFKLVDHVIEQGGVVVAHNCKFDVRAFNTTSKALGLTIELDDRHMFDTMVSSAAYSPLKTTNGRRKNFKNEELYAHLFGSAPDPTQLHDALGDCRVTAASYAEGKRRGWW